MAEIQRSVLFGKLNSVGYKSLESATVFCKMRGNPYVELAHWIQQILQLQDSDLHKIIQYFGLNSSRLAADVTAALDKLPRGATSISELSSHLDEAMERAWVFATLLFKETVIRTGHVVFGVLQTRGLANVMVDISREFDRIRMDVFSESFHKIVQGSTEDTLVARDGTVITGGVSLSEPSSTMSPAVMGKQEALGQFSINLTEKVKKGDIDPILGRDEEIRQIIDILMRRRQNNPILIGEAGVGKTAVVEGVALRIAGGDVPPALKGVTIRRLDLGLLQSGASMKGEFENRLRQVIEEVQSSPRPIILFVDDAHTFIGDGGVAGQGDAANLLEWALARGTLRTIAATTWGEYKKYFEKDQELTRRFQVIKVDEPDERQALVMIRGLASVNEKHHRVYVLDEALEAAVSLSRRYIPARQLPEKAVSLLDAACVRVAISQHCIPAKVEDTLTKIQALETEMEILDREISLGVEHDVRKTEAEDKLAAHQSHCAELKASWKKEKELVDQILNIRWKLRKGSDGNVENPYYQQTNNKTHALPEQVNEPKVTLDIDAPVNDMPEATVPKEDDDQEELLTELKSLQNKLRMLQGDSPLVLPHVDAQAVASVVADWTGIPVGRIVRDEIEVVLNLAGILEARVIGQRHALDVIAKSIQTSRAGSDNPGRPVSVFMLAGPSGVGKTETALALAQTLYGDDENIITINMDKFQEAHAVSTLIGVPPGNFAYEKWGILTEAVRRRPYSVILFDKVEKAHADVHEIFFQIFDKGVMEDGEGRVIDFKNTVILLTTNCGSELITNMCQDPELMPDADSIAKGLIEPLRKVFPAALLGRLTIVPYYPVNDSMLESIIHLQLGRIKRRLIENRKVEFSYDESVLNAIKNRCTEVESGACMVDAILTHTLLPEISKQFLSSLAEGREITRVHVKSTDNEFVYAFD